VNDSSLGPPSPLGIASRDTVRLIAFYLTQFHPIPENDEWWGKGFTEWTNASKASPLFDGHYQPHLPGELGFYDLRVPETMQEQMRLAAAHGIDGFCYHYYWFSGKRLLERPLDDMLANPELTLPFCLCWANETWTRRWDGAENRVLLAQRYRPEDDLNFIRDLVPFLRDPRYIRIGGAPLLLVYRPQQLPDTRRSAEIWRTHCREVGIGEIHLCGALTHGNTTRPAGFDSTVDFPPHNANGLKRITSARFHEPFAGNVTDFADNARFYLELQHPAGRHFRTVFPSWDNTARSGSRANIVINANPANYEYWLSESIRKAECELPRGQQLVFINAWNEWAEGCHLEPDRVHGRGFLEATARAKKGQGMQRGFSALPTGLTHSRAEGGFTSELRLLVRHHFWLAVGNAGNVLKRYPRLRRAVRWLARKGG
jgi:lipopolysaccharide biosynthesis protein